MSKRNLFGGGTFKDYVSSNLKKTGLEFRKLTSIRDNVYIVQTNKERYLLKGFDNSKKLNSQVKLTRKLKASGFDKTYDFISGMEPFQYDHYLFAWIEYLPPQRKKFSYSSWEKRQEGLILLKNFHSATNEFYRSIPVKQFDQLAKWEDRLKEFEEHIGVIKKYVSIDILETWMKWARLSLKGLEKHEKELYEEALCINHGDVAHHNFFYKSDGDLYLIDFDLINIAPPIIDYLQYCNRIMPDISGSSELWSYEPLGKYKNNRAFLYALLFPTDIFREWNRLVRENGFRDSSYLHSVWRLTVEEMPQRMRIYKEIRNMI